MPVSLQTTNMNALETIKLTSLSVGRWRVGSAFVSGQIDQRKLSVKRFFVLRTKNDLEDGVRSEKSETV